MLHLAQGQSQSRARRKRDFPDGERLVMFSRTQSPRVNWYLRRVTVRHRRCSESGTKLNVSSRATDRFSTGYFASPCRQERSLLSSQASPKIGHLGSAENRP